MRDPLAGTSIKYKLTASFVGICLLAFGVGGYMVSTSARDALEREITLRLEAQAGAVAARLDARLEQLARRVEDFASDGYVRTLFERAGDASLDRRARNDALTRLAEHLARNKFPLIPVLAGIAVCDSTGCMVTAVGAVPARIGASYAQSQRTWVGPIASFSSYDDATHASGGTPRARPLPHQGATDSIRGFVLGTPLRDLPNGRTLGTLLFAVDAVRFARMDAPGGGSRTGSSADAALTGDAAADAGSAGAAAPVWSLRDPRGAVIDLEETRSAAHAAPDRPRRYLVTLDRPMAHPGWRVRVALDAADAMEAVSGLQSRFLGAGLLFAGAALVLMFFPIRFLVRPLTSMREAARRISRGDYDVHVDTPGDDEIGDLAHAFNSMAAAVRERTQSLSRTARLLERRSHELRLERDVLDSLVRSMQDAVLSLDRTGSVLLHNDAAAPLAEALRRGGAGIAPWRCTGANGDAAVCADAGTSAAAAVPAGAAADSGTHPSRSCASCLLHPGPAPLTCTIEHAGSVYEILSTRVGGAHGTAHGRMLVARDVTERLRIGAQEAHRERLALVGEIAASMAHELNNPLASITLYAQLMERELPEDAPHREHVDVIRRNAAQCSRAVRGLLDYARSAGDERCETDLRDVAEEALQLVRPMADRAAVSLLLRGDAHDTVRCVDDALLGQALVNLLINAIQAADEGGRIEVELVARPDGAHTLRVIDNGPGIAAEHRAHVFDAFFTTKAAGEGTGLGLTTARRIVEGQHGQLDLEESRPGRTVFVITLPPRGEQARDTGRDTVADSDARVEEEACATT